MYEDAEPAGLHHAQAAAAPEPSRRALAEAAEEPVDIDENGADEREPDDEIGQVAPRPALESARGTGDDEVDDDAEHDRCRRKNGDRQVENATPPRDRAAPGRVADGIECQQLRGGGCIVVAPRARTVAEGTRSAAVDDAEAECAA